MSFTPNSVSPAAKPPDSSEVEMNKDMIANIKGLISAMRNLDSNAIDGNILL